MTEHNSTPQTPDFTPTGWEGRAHYRWVDEDGRVVRVERYPMEQEVHTALRQARLAHQQLRYYRSDWAWTDVAKSPVAWHDLPESHGAVSEEPGTLLGFAVGSIAWVFDSGLRAAWFAANRFADNCNPRPKIRPIIDGKIRSELVVTLNPDTDVFECRDPLATAPGYVTSPADDEPTPIPAGTLVIPEQLPVEPAALTETKGLWPDGSTSDTGPDLQNPTEIRSFTGPKQGTISFVGKFDKDLYAWKDIRLYFPKDNEPDPVDPPEDPPGWTEAWADAWKDTPKPATTVDARVDKFPQVLVTNGDTPMIIVQCNENRSDYIEAASVMAIHWEEAPDGATVIVTVETESRDVQPNLRCFTLPAHLLERFVDALDHAVVWGTK